MTREQTGEPEMDGDRDVPPHILVVDDSPSNLTAIEAVLRDLGARVRTSHSGEDALRQLLNHDFAVILLDVNLPGLSGFDTAQLIRSRERSRHVPIIFITGHSQGSQQVRRGYALGAVDYLFKPIVGELLRAKVRVFLELHNRTVEVARQAKQLRMIERIAAERKLAEERRRWEAEELRWQVREQRLLNERLSEIDQRKDEFIALLAHELRNPLVPLVVGLELMASQEAETAAFHETRSRMQRQLKHLTRLVDDLLDVARISQGKLELHRARIDLRQVVSRASDMCRAEIEQRNQSLVVEGSSEDVPLDADEVRLTQVVSNLLGNASRYSEPGSSIWLRWGIENDRAFIRVTDEGCGIAPDFLGRVFDVFEQERGEGTGLGLGLALVRELVEKHDGTVEALSDGPGRGSEFVVRLPLFSGDEVEHEEECALEPPAVGPPLRIFLIEDDSDVHETIGSLLERWGHSVVGVAEEGSSGVVAVAQTLPDVVLIDIGLPDIDGYEVARRIHRQLGSDRPALLAMTGYGQSRDRELAREAGFDLHITKPPEPHLLVASLHAARRLQAHAAEPVAGNRTRA